MQGCCTKPCIASFDRIRTQTKRELPVETTGLKHASQLILPFLTSSKTVTSPPLYRGVTQHSSVTSPSRAPTRSEVKIPEAFP